MQCDQFKELLKDKEEEIQTLIQELDKGRTQSLDQDEIGMMNNQVQIAMRNEIYLETILENSTYNRAPHCSDPKFGIV